MQVRVTKQGYGMEGTESRPSATRIVAVEQAKDGSLLRDVIQFPLFHSRRSPYNIKHNTSFNFT